MASGARHSVGHVVGVQEVLVESSAFAEPGKWALGCGAGLSGGRDGRSRVVAEHTGVGGAGPASRERLGLQIQVWGVPQPQK